MELGDKLLNSLRIETQFFKRLQSVSVVDGATHSPTPERMMWRVTEAPWRMLQRSLFVLFLCGVQLVLRSGVFTILDLDKVGVMPRFAEVLRSMLSGVGGPIGGWRCC